jgi:hypothetical protein
VDRLLCNGIDELPLNKGPPLFTEAENRCKSMQFPNSRIARKKTENTWEKKQGETPFFHIPNFQFLEGVEIFVSRYPTIHVSCRCFPKAHAHPQSPASQRLNLDTSPGAR